MPVVVISGNVQFALSVRIPALTTPIGSNSISAQNDGTGTSATPFTSCVFSNVTCLGPKNERNTPISQYFHNAIHLRRNNKIKIYNSFFTGYPNRIFFQGNNTVSNAENGELALKHNVLAGVENWGGNGYGSAGIVFVNSTVGVDTVMGVPTGRQHSAAPRGSAFPGTDLISGQSQQNWFVATGNQMLDKWQNAGISPNAFVRLNPDYLPTPGSMLLSGAGFSEAPLLDTFFTPVSFRGAFGNVDWTADWAEWNPEMADYTGSISVSSQNLHNNDFQLKCFPNPFQESLNFEFSIPFTRQGGECEMMCFRCWMNVIRGLQVYPAFRISVKLSG